MTSLAKFGGRGGGGATTMGAQVRPSFGDSVMVHDGTAWRAGKVVDEVRDYRIVDMDNPQGQVVSVRVWLDGDSQPESELRPISTVAFAA